MRLGYSTILLLGSLLFSCKELEAKTYAGTVIEFEDQVIYASYSASFVGAPEITEPLTSYFYVPSKDRYGCSNSIYPPRNEIESSNFVAVLKRGGTCSFQDRILKAQQAGAKAVLVVNTIEGLYNSSNGALLNSCSLNCDLKMSTSKTICEQSCSHCAENININSGSYCCLDDSLLDMYVGRKVLIPSFFISLQDGDDILFPALKRKSVMECTIYDRPLREVDYSVFVIAFIACTVLILSTYRATSKERSLAKWIWQVSSSVNNYDNNSTVLHEDVHLEQHHLTILNVLGFLCMSTCSLFLLFLIVQFYPHEIVRILQVLFAFGAATSFGKIFVQPIIRQCVSSSLADRDCERFTPSSCCFDDSNKSTCSWLTSLVIGLIISSLWLFNRHSSWSWIPLNFLAASLVCTFLLTIRLPSLRVATVLLVSFFAYDIFMVFITPSLFSGRSVMVDVATAGKSIEKADGTKCVRKQEEIVPMLFSCPRFDWIGGYSLLGLGDVVLPGLLVVLALRFDYAKLRYKFQAFQSTTVFPKPSFFEIHSYWIPICISYCLGLIMTFVANIRGWTFNGVRGQPALLYLVPFTLGSFFFLLWKRNDLSFIWNSEIWQEWENNKEEVADEEDEIEQGRSQSENIY